MQVPIIESLMADPRTVRLFYLYPEALFMFDILANRTYRHLFLAQIIALLGTGLLTVALGLLAFQLAGDQAGKVLGTALAIKMIAYVTVAPIVGPLRRSCRGAPSWWRWTWYAPASPCCCPSSPRSGRFTC
jgi:hypothetical protein